MIKTKLLAAVSAVVALLAFSTAPAFAEWESGTTHGKMTTGTVVFEGGGLTLTCASTAGEWKIRTAGKIEEQNKEGKQVPATKGPHLNDTIKEWKGCGVITKSGLKATPTLGECTLQFEQPKGVFTAKLGFVSQCKIEVTVLFIVCSTIIVAAKEGEKINFGLEKNVLESSGTNSIIIRSEDSGITTTVGNGCEPGGIEAGKEHELKATFMGEGLKAV